MVCLSCSKGRHLDLIQHRILKSILHVPKFALNIFVQAIANCPPMSVRQTILRHSRQSRLRSRWNSDWWVDDAVILTQKGLRGEVFPEDPSLPSPQIGKAIILFDRFVEPTDTLLKSRFEGELSYAVLQKLVKLRISPGLLRLFALWIIQSWRKFVPRVCRTCHQVIEDQLHILQCSQLCFKLDQNPLIPVVLPFDPPRPRSPHLVVEERLRSIVSLPNRKPLL